MKPGDIVVLHSGIGSLPHIWVIEGVYLGALKQENLVEVRSLTESPGSAGNKVYPTTVVPMAFLDRAAIYEVAAKR